VELVTDSVPNCPRVNYHMFFKWERTGFPLHPVLESSRHVQSWRLLDTGVQKGKFKTYRKQLPTLDNLPKPNFPPRSPMQPFFFF
jgi:hypothetical protein